MKGITILAFAAVLASGMAAAQEDAGTPAATEAAAPANPASPPPAPALPVDESWPEAARAFIASLRPQRGEVKIEAASVTLNVPDSFYFLAAADARKVLEDAWRNPPDERILGMLFPSSVSPLHDNAWGVTIAFQQDGYVSDKDAESIDYDELLEQMKADSVEENKFRAEKGYDTVELIGWAARPHYNRETHKLYWAKELKFGKAETNTLNYDIRALGRKGVLVLSFIASMENLPEIEKTLPSVLNMVNFDDGARYDDFDPKLDQIAAYGIGGLIAGKVLAKTGFFALALVFLKKFGVILAAVVVGGLAWMRKKVLGGRPSGES